MSNTSWSRARLLVTEIQLTGIWRHTPHRLRAENTINSTERVLHCDVEDFNMPICPSNHPRIRIRKCTGDVRVDERKRKSSLPATSTSPFHKHSTPSNLDNEIPVACIPPFGSYRLHYSAQRFLGPEDAGGRGFGAEPPHPSGHNRHGWKG